VRLARGFLRGLLVCKACSEKEEKREEEGENINVV
jgi:hypothetical protein